MSAEGKRDFIREIIASDLASGKHGTTITRFPPEPNGYLHIGHAKSICLNFGIAQENADSGAVVHLRFDDTNPVKEDVEYVESIKADIKWLGFDWGDKLFFASDYFETMYECAVALIKDGKAYVDEDSPEEIKAKRGDVVTPGTPSDYRERPVEESLARFAAMRAGEVPEGGAVLRAKIDLETSNMNMRDPILYRVMHAPHHRTGDAWCIYPMYDFAHSIEDALEHITHSLCTLEFENHRPLYDWVVDNCPLPSKPRQIEFAKLMLSHTIMGKRNLLGLVEDGIVDGWDDPRMPTISGMRRRGYPASALRAFCHRVGVTKQNSMTDIALLEFEVRDELNRESGRYNAVLDPLKLVITNWLAGKEEAMTLSNHPEDESRGTREVVLGGEVYIEREDFELEPPKKYFRLTPDQGIRLRGGYILTYENHVLADDGSVAEVHVRHHEGTIGQSAPEGVKCRAAVHWVDAKTAVDATVRLYDRLVTVENPNAHPDGIRAVINEDSLTVIEGVKVEPALAAVKAGTRCQFERVGYFVADEKEHVAGEKPVFNRIVALKDSWGKKK